MGLRWIIIGIFFIALDQTQAQSSLLDELIIPYTGSTTTLNHLEYIQREMAISLSYSTSRFDTMEVIRIQNPQLTLRDYLDKLFDNYQHILIESGEKVIVVIQSLKKSPVFNLRGYIRDSQNGELLIGAYLQDLANGNTVVTNDRGYYNIQLNTVPASLEASYLSYSPKTMVIQNAENNQVDIMLEFNNALQPIVISEQKIDTALLFHQPIRLDPSLNPYKAANSNQEGDLLYTLKRINGVQTESEGQSGFYVRGGSPDQNLVLLEGLPLYEVSHTVGLSSIFIEESIRNATFQKGGFSAAYGGRTASVLDITLKEGNAQEVHGSISLGGFSGMAHLEGPIAKNTSFHFAGKRSWLEPFVQTLISRQSDFDDVGVAYQDVSFKLSHRFSPATKLSYAFKSGSDDLTLERGEFFTVNQYNKFNLSETNSVSWGTRLHALNLDMVIGSKWYLKVQGGLLNYNYSTLGDYRFRHVLEDSISSRVVQVNTFASIEDRRLNSALEYYFDNDDRFTTGIQVTDHNYQPTLKQSDIIIGQTSGSIANDSTVYAGLSLAWFAEWEHKWSPTVKTTLGHRLSQFRIDGTTYTNSEPRLTFDWTLNPRLGFTLNISRMTQPIHLLINPGIGLPSELWVPSTSIVRPQIGDEISTRIGYKIKSWLIELEAYQKWQNHLLEYASTTDIYFAILNGNDVAPIDDQNRRWEERITSGTGRARGLELTLLRRAKSLNGFFNIAWSKAERTFEDINRGQPFPFKYDRRINISTGIQYRINDHWTFGTNWSYGTGHWYTLAIEVIPTPDGQEIVVSDDRNNLRLPSFSRLDVNLLYTHILKDYGRLTAGLHVTNVYNRFNPYYVYLFYNQASNTNEFRQVSLFPFIPNLSLKFSF